MADLRLVGVHEDGGHLLLSGPNGDNYLLPLDEALRNAVIKATHHSTRTASTPSARMTPREIQSMIRSGATAADVSLVSGHTIEQIRRYEGPVLAERDYIASQARKVEVADASTHNEGYRSTFGEHPASLDDMVKHRLTAFGIDPKSLRWDAWRDDTGGWTVSADFEQGTEWAANSIGEAAPALWRFHPTRKSLHNANRWAQQLSELEPLDSPVPERRLSAVIDQPFDIDADAAELANDATEETTVTDTPETEDYPGHGLLDMLRSRRGVRIGLDEDGDDELAAMLGSHVPGAHPRNEELYGAPTTDPEDSDVESAEPASRLRNVPFLQLAPRLPEHEEPAPDSVAEVSTETREVILSGEPALVALDEEPAPSDSEVAARLERKAAAKPKRSSVPSWDEIVFGTKGD